MRRGKGEREDRGTCFEPLPVSPRFSQKSKCRFAVHCRVGEWKLIGRRDRSAFSSFLSSLSFSLVRIIPEMRVSPPKTVEKSFF